MDAFLNYMLSQITSDTESIKITDESDDTTVRYKVEANPDDYPKIIGKKGMTIKALTDILKLYQAKNTPEDNRRIFINIAS